MIGVLVREEQLVFPHSLFPIRGTTTIQGIRLNKHFPPRQYDDEAKLPAIRKNHGWHQGMPDNRNRDSRADFADTMRTSPMDARRLVQRLRIESRSFGELWLRDFKVAGSAAFRGQGFAQGTDQTSPLKFCGPVAVREYNPRR